MLRQASAELINDATPYRPPLLLQMFGKSTKLELVSSKRVAGVKTFRSVERRAEGTFIKGTAPAFPCQRAFAQRQIIAGDKLSRQGRQHQHQLAF